MCNYKIAMATFPPSQCQDGALTDATENINTRKSTIKWLRVFENCFDENGLEKNPETVRPGQLDKVLERFFACMCKQDGTDHDCERNLSPMILKDNLRWPI